MERSAGILIYRFAKDGEIEVLLGKCGGPKWKNRFAGAWNIPKGRVEAHESDLVCALREFNEETALGLEMPSSVDELLDLGTSVTSAGKTVKIFAVERNYNPSGSKVLISSVECLTEWPAGSGKMIKVPEMCEAMYFKLSRAKGIIFPYQKIFLTRLEEEIKKNNNLY